MGNQEKTPSGKRVACVRDSVSLMQEPKNGLKWTISLEFKRRNPGQEKAVNFSSCTEKEWRRRLT